MTPQEVNECTIFMMLGGSHAYGTNTEGSDIDYRGVCIPRDKSYYVGFLKKFEQQDSGWDEEDKVVYDLRKCIKLMADGNPNMVDFLFARDEETITTTDAWERIREHREKFLSLKMRHTYSGYAYSQLKRIKRHRRWVISPPEKKPERADFGLPERKMISSDQLAAFQWMLARFMQESVEWFKLSPETQEQLSGVNFIGPVQANLPPETLPVIKDALEVSDNFIEAVSLEKKYATAKKEWDSFQAWQSNRNRKRYKMEQQYGYDPKHGAHLVRLMRMGYEIVAEGRVEVYRSDRDELLEIRNGAWSYDQLEAYAEEMENKIAAAVEHSPLPKQPARTFLDGLCQEVIETYVFNA